MVRAPEVLNTPWEKGTDEDDGVAICQLQIRQDNICEFGPLATRIWTIGHYSIRPKKHVYKIQNLSQTTRQQAILSYLESTCAKYE